jgi:hypothetical protein
MHPEAPESRSARPPGGSAHDDLARTTACSGRPSGTPEQRPTGTTTSHPPEIALEHEHHDRTCDAWLLSDARSTRHPPSHITSLSSARPTRLAAFPSSSSLLMLMLTISLLAAAPPPASPLFAWAAPPDLSCRSRKGRPARSGGRPFLESPGVTGDFGPEAGRRPGSLEGEPPRANHLQRTTYSEPPASQIRTSAVRAIRVAAVIGPENPARTGATPSEPGRHAICREFASPAARRRRAAPPPPSTERAGNARGQPTTCHEWESAARRRTGSPSLVRPWRTA